MRKLAFTTLGAALVVSTMAAIRFGGWAVVTVEKIPDHWVVGKPLQLTFHVRQHGVSSMEGLSPRVQARSGSRVINGVTWAFEEDGVKAYRSRIAFPQRGEWQVTINSGFGNSRATLIPWRVVDSGGPIRKTVEEHLQGIGIPPLPDVERGRRLFVAKGCVTCHVHGSVDIAGELRDAGPDLTNRRFAADYLAKFLADPSIKPQTPGMMRMPNLGLKQKDIAPIVAFINSERRLTSRRASS